MLYICDDQMTSDSASALKEISENVRLQCIKVGSRLRVRIISPGYLPNANCQFPRAIRAEGREYLVPNSEVALVRTGSAGKYFYRVKKKHITICADVHGSGDNKDHKVTLNAIYGDEEENECLICMDAEKTTVFSPCGHYCCCQSCAHIIDRNSGTCPLCRGEISLCVGRDNVALA